MEKRKIKIKVNKKLEERCQKGYKTHPKRKTKKMFGRTYRNCVKAEGKVEEVYSDKQRRFMCAVSKQGADRPIHMEVGDMTMLPSYVLHKITPVTKGERWSLVTWIQDIKPFR